MTKGEALMALSRPEDAVESYKAALEEGPNDLVRTFNVAEGIRRATKKSDQRLWQSVIELHENDREDHSASMYANTAQAMHIAYACVGNLGRAKELLHEARKRVSSMPEVANIFSVRTYQFVKKSRFLQDNQEFLDALDKGMLWDGMKIPSTEDQAVDK
jgi:uncharacterized protein (DUF2461 family)